MREFGISIGKARPSESRSEQTVTAVEAASQIADPMLSRLYAYWDARRGDRRFPGRSDIDPLDIPTLLSSVFLVTVRRDPFDLVFRLAGTVITDCYGGGVTGTRLSELASTGASDLYREAARTVRCGGPAILSGPLNTRADAYGRVDHLLLPLGESPDQVDMLIGGAIFRNYPIGERPYRTAGAAPWGPRIRPTHPMRPEPILRYPVPAGPTGPDAPETHTITAHKTTGT
jgi:hypothetical protein